MLLRHSQIPVEPVFYRAPPPRSFLCKPTIAVPGGPLADLRVSYLSSLHLLLLHRHLSPLSPLGHRPGAHHT